MAFTTSPHHPGSFVVPGDAWVKGEPQQQSFVLPWTVATLKDDIHVVGTQGSVTAAFTERVAVATAAYLELPDADH